MWRGLLDAHKGVDSHREFYQLAYPKLRVDSSVRCR